jgi:hypothetical protein
MGVALHRRLTRGVSMDHKRLMLLAILVGFLPATGEAARSARLCVTPGGTNGCFRSIQDAIDAAPMGATIKVYPGRYVETATNRFVLGRGPYQFGLFISAFKSGISLQGVDANGEPIEDYRHVKAFITTVATNSFGPSGIFVEGDNVTIQGFDVGINLAGQDKTIEVIGDNFTLKYADISDQRGSVYVDDFRFDTNSNTSHVESYRIDGNNFQDGVSLDLANGAGFSGPVDRRRITGNSFTNQFDWPSISFNGSGTGVPFFVHSVGGAVIADNVFVNTFSADPHSKKQGHIRARGTYDNRQFDWASYWRENEYNHAFVVGPNPPSRLRAYTYTSLGFTFRNVRRIGAICQAEQDNAQPGDRVLAKRQGDDDRDDHDHGDHNGRDGHRDRNGHDDRDAHAGHDDDQCR